MELLSKCPICAEAAFKEFLKCKDYTVSSKNFIIVECENCNLRYTNPRPEESKIGDYYKSEEYISHSDTSKGVINKLYQNVRKITLKQKLDLINKYSANKKILDVGCGTGAFLNSCRKDGWESIGVEPDENARKKAAEHPSLRIGDEALLKDLPKESFGIISMWHVLEHVYHLDQRVEELKALLHKEGKLIIAVPNCSSYDAEYYGAYWAAYDVPRHLYHFRPKNIKELMSRHSLKVEKILPMKFDAFYVSMLSEKYMNNKVNYLSALKVALQSNYLASKNKSYTYSSQIYIIGKI